MKIQCNACKAREANVLCCADEAALCWSCDENIHAANKLATEHHRVPLSSSSSSQVPKCDICQESAGYFFCLEDRALLCRKCDVGIHTSNSFVSGHQRFLLTGVKLGLDQETQLVGTSSTSNNVPETSSSQSVSVPCVTNPWTREANEAVSKDDPFAGADTDGGFSEWRLDELLGIVNVDHQNDEASKDNDIDDSFVYYQR